MNDTESKRKRAEEPETKWQLEREKRCWWQRQAMHDQCIGKCARQFYQTGIKSTQTKQSNRRMWRGNVPETNIAKTQNQIYQC